jgi:hypothetical protein
LYFPYVREEEDIEIDKHTITADDVEYIIYGHAD